MLNNKLFGTFSDEENLEYLLEDIKIKHNIIYNKIFILKLSNNELLCTYNVEIANTLDILPGTIMIHRKKESNTLYTINALNELIKSLNNGYLDKSYTINWNDYKNCLLLTQENELKQLGTQILRIENL
jgi:hypothetical protein